MIILLSDHHKLAERVVRFPLNTKPPDSRINEIRLNHGKHPNKLHLTSFVNSR